MIIYIHMLFPFAKYRTFFIVFGVLVIFIMMFVQFWTKEDNFAAMGIYFTDDNRYEKGGSVNINGQFTHPTDVYKRYNINGPLSKNSASSLACEALCNTQDECNPIRENKCVSAFDPDKKTCACSFSKDIQIGVNNQTATNFMSIINSLPNDAKPCFTYPLTNRVYSKVDNDKVLWPELNIRNNNQMAISFWIYLEASEEDNSKDIHFFTLQLNKAQSSKGYLRGNNIVLLNNKGIDVIIPIEDSSWITINFNNGAQHIYINGVLTPDTYIAPKIFSPPDETSALTLKKTKEGLFIKDLKMYDHSLSERVIGLIYNGGV